MVDGNMNKVSYKIPTPQAEEDTNVTLNSFQGLGRDKGLQTHNKGKIPKQVRNDVIYAFSLIELMISLIVVSCITAAFTPVITKKLKTNSLIAGAVSSGLKNLQISPEECKNAIGVDYCTICDVKKKECISCSSDACDKTHQYTITKDCTCAECSTKFQNCETCSETACKSCKNGSHLQNDICEDCPSGKICDGTSKTPKDPQPGYYAKDGMPYSCQEAIPNCKECSSSKSGSTTTVTCSKCLKNTYLAADKKSCANCDKTQYCPEGTTQTGIKACTDLTKNCAECDADNCTKCLGTLKLNGNKCTTCDPGYTCDGSSTQNPCTTGYYCTGGQSYACSAKSGNTNCIDCDKTNGTCTKCTLGTHKLNTSTSKCENCDTGYWCSNGISKDNGSCTTGCKVCANTSTCTTCSSGYYKNSSNKCDECPAGYYCTGGSKTACDIGKWSSGGTGCTDKTTCCSATPPTGTWCSNGSCSSCTTGCKTCASSNTCTTCSSGYYKNSLNKCDTCPAGYWCDSNAKYSCDTGKWSDSGASSSTSCTTDKCGSGNWCENGSKTQCSANCSSCASANSCSSSGCTGGMQLDANGKCSTPSGVCTSTSTGACCTNSTPPNTSISWCKLNYGVHGDACYSGDGTKYSNAYMPSAWFVKSGSSNKVYAQCGDGGAWGWFDSSYSKCSNSVCGTGYMSRTWINNGSDNSVCTYNGTYYWYVCVKS